LAGRVTGRSPFSEEAEIEAGRHPTTALCRAFLEARAAARPLGSVLDVGTGGGVLAVHAHRLGARGVVAVDRDRVQAARTRARVRALRLDKTVEVRAIPADRVAGRFDVVVANLWCDDLVAAAADLARLVARPGELFCTGWRLWQTDRVRSALEGAGLHIRAVRARDGWAGFSAGPEGGVR
jgi:ribosomal protein L11 methylase PrmA